MIPKIIHYCWFGRGKKSELITKCIESWKKYCPDFEIREWNEDNFDINSNTFVKEAYESKKWAFVTDYVRLYALYNYGGIYMDTDVELLTDIEKFLCHSSFSGFEDYKSIPTAIMGSQKGNEWIGKLLSYYDDRHFIKENGELDTVTNVVIITDITTSEFNVRLDNTYQDLPGILTLYPKDYFCPKDYETGNIELTQNTVCIHHFNASWHDDFQKKVHDKNVYFKEKYGENWEKHFKRWYRINAHLERIRKKGFSYIIEKLKKLLK